MSAVPRMRVTPPAITLRQRAEFIPIYPIPPHDVVEGRVPQPCGECVGTALDPSASCQSAGYQPSKQVCNPSSKPPGLSRSARQRLNAMRINRYRFFNRLWLRPWRHPRKPHLCERPHVIGPSRCHRWCIRPPYLDSATAVGGLGHPQRLAHTRMRQADIVVRVVAQFLAICRASILAERLGYAVSFSSLWRGKRRV